MCPIYEYNRFPDNFTLYCPELKQDQALPQFRCVNHQFFEKKIETWFWNTFATPLQDAHRFELYQPPGRQEGKLSLLEALPSELIEEIIDNLFDDTETSEVHANIISLGLSAQRLWPIVLHRVHMGYQPTQSTNWAGKHITFQGLYARPLPQHAKNYGLDPNAFEFSSVLRSGPGWKVLSHLSNQPEATWLQSLANVPNIQGDFTRKERYQIEQDLSQMYLYPQDRIWVLRNLTTRQYIRSDGLYPLPSNIPTIVAETKMSVSKRLKVEHVWEHISCKKDKQPCDPKTNQTTRFKDGPLTFPQILLILTSHSTPGYTPYPECLYDFQDGPWTSHAFDVVTWEAHIATIESKGKQSVQSGMQKAQESEADDRRWTDVTMLAVADVGSVRDCISALNDKIEYGGWKMGERRDPDSWAKIKEVRNVSRAWAAPGAPETAWEVCA